LVLDGYLVAEESLEGAKRGTFSSRLAEHLGGEKFGTAGTDECDLGATASFGDNELCSHSDSYILGGLINPL
jgi:hypothetical protein